MKYYRGTQFVPGKGMAEMYWEADDEDTVVRCMTVVPSTGEVDRLDKPIVKKLFRPELLESVTPADFERYWAR